MKLLQCRNMIFVIVILTLHYICVQGEQVFNKTGLYFGLQYSENELGGYVNSGRIVSIGDNSGLDNIISTRYTILTNLENNNFIDGNINFGKTLLRINKLGVGPYVGGSISYSFQDKGFKFCYLIGLNVDYALTGDSLNVEEFGFLNFRIGYANSLFDQVNAPYTGSFLISVGIEGPTGKYNVMPL